MIGREGTSPARRLARALAATALAAAACAAPAGAADVPVTATVETAPVHTSGDAADDSAIWIHPTDPSQSTLIGTDKAGGGLVVYDLAGREIQYAADGRLNNVDVRYNFPLGSTTVSIVGASNRVARTLDFYRVQVSDRRLVRIGSFPVSSRIGTPRGFSLYRSPVSGRYYAYVTDSGWTEQYELSGATGSVTGRLVRGPWQIAGPQHTEGLVADDQLGRLYLAQEDAGGLWRYGAEPGDPTTSPVAIDRTTENGGNVTQDIKGLMLYYGRDDSGYVIAISQGGNRFHLYDRRTGAHRGAFKIVAGNGIDEVTGIDGGDVTNFPLGFAFPQGMFNAQDHANPGANQNFKLVPWQAIAGGFAPPLLTDTVFDPRSIGAGSSGPADTTAPQTTIDSGPGGTGATATFAFSADEAASFECSLDGAAFSACQSPISYAGLAPGQHAFGVRARDGAGNVDASPATRTWTVETTPPPPPPPASGIARRSVATVVNATASDRVTIATPAGTAAGDVLVACLALNGGAVAATGVPPGWTPIAAVTAISNPHVFGYYRVATAAEPASSTWTLGSSLQSGGGIAAFTGVDATAPLEGTPAIASGSTAASAGNVPAVATARPAAPVGCMSINSSSTATAITSPAGLTEAWDVGGKRHELASGPVAAAGSTGARTWTFGAARAWAGWVAALRAR